MMNLVIVTLKCYFSRNLCFRIHDEFQLESSFFLSTSIGVGTYSVLECESSEKSLVGHV